MKSEYSRCFKCKTEAWSSIPSDKLNWKLIKYGTLVLLRHSWHLNKHSISSSFHLHLENKSSRDPVTDRESWSLSTSSTEDRLRHASGPVRISILFSYIHIHYPCYFLFRSTYISLLFESHLIFFQASVWSPMPVAWIAMLVWQLSKWHVPKQATIHLHIHWATE